MRGIDALNIASVTDSALCLSLYNLWRLIAKYYCHKKTKTENNN